jgi:hypothetical protein
VDAVIRRLLRRLLPGRYTEGGTLPPYTPREDSQLIVISPGREITDPDDAEALGLSAREVERLRRKQRP